MKKLFAALIALAIIVTMIPTAVFANEQQTNDLSTDTQTVSEPVEDSTEKQTQFVAEEPLFDGVGGSDCICGGKHENVDHDCAAVTWTSLSNANVDTYFTGVRIEGSHNLRLTEDVTAKKVFFINEDTTLNIDLNGHTLTVNDGANGYRAFNVYAGVTLNICDSSAANTGKIVTTRNPGTASIIACFGAPTAEKPTTVNLWGGTFTNTGSPSVPAVLCNTECTHFTMYDGVVFENIKNNSTGLGVASGVIVIGGGNTGAKSTAVFNGGIIRNCTLKCNGGAIVAFNGETTINDILIDNIDLGTKYGAGLYLSSLPVSGVYKYVPTVTMKGGKITNCKAGNGAGMYIQDGKFTLEGGQITGNTATGLIASDGSNNSYGGGIYYKPTNKLADSFCHLNGGEISDNIASGMGGGIRINANGCVINGTKITGNTAQSADGGGVYLTASATADMTAGVISDNHCGGTTTNYQASGVGIRSGCTFNVSGDSRILNNTGTGSCTVNYNFGYAGSGMRTVNIGELTDSGYVVLDLGSLDKMNLIENEANNIDDSTPGIKIYSVKHDTPLVEGDVELQAVIASEQYLGGMTYPIEIQARLTNQAAIAEAYLASAKASATSEHSSAAETTMQGGTKLNKTDWTTLGTLTADIDNIFESYSGEAVTVTAKLKADATNATEFEVECTASVNLRFDPDAHMHCACGKKDGCIYGGHETTNIIYKKITQANVNEINGKAFNGPKAYYFYLDEDITITTNITIGNKSGVPAEFYLCLNGHTVTTTGNRMIDMRNGTCTICDCQGGGTIQAKITTATPASGCIFFWQGTAYAAGSPTLNMYGGTLTYADDTAKTSSFGLVITQGNGIFNLYGGTVDGKNKGTTPNKDGGGAGGLSALQGTMNLEDCTLRNCVSNTATVNGAEKGGRGGALYVGSDGTASVTNCTFENCSADRSGGAIYATGAKDLTLSGELNFSGNKAAGEDNDIGLSSNRQLVMDNVTVGEKIKVKFATAGSYGSISGEDFNKLDVSTEDPTMEAEYTNGKIVVSQYTTDHPHCYCGGKCETGNHTHVSKTKWVACNSASQLSGVTITSETWYYLTTDITITKDITIKEGATLRICLNGHTLTTNATRAFNYYDGTVSICDCSEGQTGAVLADQTTAGDGAIVFCQNQSENHKGGAFELYSGKLAYARKSSLPGNQGLFYGSSNGAYNGLKIDMYGGTINGSNNTAATNSNAGCIYLYRGTMNMYGGVIKNGAAKANGGAVRLASNSQFNMYGGEISKCTALGGGAIYAESSATVNIYDGVIKDNTATTNGGGAIRINSGNASLNVYGGMFSNNKTTGSGKSGGTIRVAGSSSRSSKFVMTGGTIKGGRVGFDSKEGYGGAIWISSAAFIMKGGLITDCRAYSMGGGVYAGAKTTTVRIEGGTISNCMAYDQGGGGICCNRAHLVMTGGIIEENVAKCYYGNKQGGGGILMMWDQGSKKEYFFDWATAQLLGGVIRNNRSENKQGGGMYAKHCKVTMDGILFEGNYGEGDGGGGYSAGSTTYTYMKNATFRDNEALKAGGGAVINGGSFLNVDYAVFENNYSGTNGGGLMLYNVEGAHIKDLLCAGNVSKSTGGGLYIRSRYQGATIDNMTLRDNKGSSGGGAYFYLGVTINNCHVFNNIANLSGGGIYFAADTDGIMNGGTIEKNNAGSNGGGIYASSRTELKNVIIRDNTCAGYGGGIYENMGSKNCNLYINIGNGVVISGNKAKYGGAIANKGNYNHVTIDGAEIYGNNATIDGGAVFNRFESYLTLASGKIHDNECGGNGGAIYGQGRIELFGGEIYSNKAGGIGGTAYFCDDDNDTESYQHNVFIFDGVKAYGNKAKTANGIYLTKTAAGLIKDGILMSDASFEITLSTTNDITKTLQGAYNYRKLGNNTYLITDASNALRPSEIDKDGKVIFVGEVVSIESVKAAQAEQERLRQQKEQQREEDEDPELDEEIVVIDDNTSTDDYTNVGNT